jgi:hypothetical protein
MEDQRTPANAILALDEENSNAIEAGYTKSPAINSLFRLNPEGMFSGAVDELSNCPNDARLLVMRQSL